MISYDWREVIGLFCSRLRELRKGRGLTQKRLAEIMGLNINTIAQYERGNREPKFDTLCKLADFFDVSLDYLLGRQRHDKYSFLECLTCKNKCEEFKELYDAFQKLSKILKLLNEKDGGIT